MRIRVLGPLLVDDRASLSPRDQVVLEALVAEPGRPLSPDTLAEAMWGEERPHSWAKLIPSSILRIRKVLGAAAVETTPQGYRLVLGGEAVDAVRFERLVDRGRQLLVVGEADRARHVLREALALWRGRPLAEVEEWEPGRAAADRLDETRREAEETVIEAALRAGTPAEVVAEARARVAQEPLRERRWSLLALAQYLSGDAAAALATLRQARSRLAEELGLDPGPDLEQLEQAMLRRDPSLVLQVALPESAPRSPYPGLRPFDVDEGEFFFGRDTEVRQCLERLAESGCLVLVGPSGCGKSSLLRAGVVAALRRDDAEVFMLGPGVDPTVAVLELVHAGFAGTLVIDQLDEILAACGPDERRELVAALVEHSGWWRLAVTIREDHLADVADEPALARLLERGTYILGPMTEEGMREAVVRPAAEAALVLEPGLVDLLITEVTGAPGALPLMAHALNQTWERREGRTLTVDGYHASGGISGAVAQTAERVYEDLSVTQRDALRDLLKRLIAVAPDGAPMRVWAPVQQLGAGGRDDLVEVLVRARLLTRDDGVVAVAHESLARFWPRLRGWLEDDVEGRRILRHLTDAAESWEALGRVDSELYRGVRLGRALDWQASSGVSLTPLETEFLEASARQRDEEQRREALAARRQRRQTRRVRVLLATSAGLVLVLVGAASFGLRQRDLAADASVASQANAVRAVAYEASDPVVAALAGVEAVRLRDDAQSRAALHQALDRWPALLGSVEVPGALSLSVGAGGSVVLGHPWKVTVHDPRSLAQLSVVDGRGQRVHLLGAGRDLLVGTSESEVLVVDLSTGRRVSLLGSAPGEIDRVDASDDGWVRAAQHYDWQDGLGTVRVWRGRDGALTLPPMALAGFALAPDGSRVVLRHRSSSPALTVVDVGSGRQLAAGSADQLGLAGRPAPDALAPMAMSRDGRLVAVGDGDGVVVLDAGTLEVRWRAADLGGPLLGLGFSPDGSVLVGGAGTGTLTVWTVDGRVREELPGSSRPVVDLGFSPDGAVLYTLTADGRLSSWDLRGNRRSVQLLRPPAEEATRLVASPSPDGTAVATTAQPDLPGGTGVLTLVDVVTASTTRGPTASPSDRIVAWQPGGTGRFATFGTDVIRVWDRGRPVAERRMSSDVTAVAYTPDGRGILVGGGDGSVYRVDAETLLPVGGRAVVDDDVSDLEWVGANKVLALVQVNVQRHYRVVDLTDGSTGPPRLLGMDEVTRTDVSPDGRLVALGGYGGELGLASLDTGEWVLEPRNVHAGPVDGVAFSPDGSMLVTSADDGRVRLWDGRSGESRGSVRATPPGVESFVGFTEDGHALMVAGGDGSLRRWDLRTDTWIQQACDRAGRNLTTDEWADIFGDDRPYRRTCPDVDGGP